MTVRLKTLAALVALAAGAPAFALDLLEAYRDALASDPQLASARSQLQAIRERVPQARAALLPQVSATAAVMRQDFDTNLAPARQFNSQSYGIQLSYPLLRKPYNEVLEQSKLQVTAGEAQLLQAEQDLILRVSQAYFDLLAAQDNLETIRAQKRAISEQLASAKRNFEVGTATITDQQEAQARFDLTSAQEIAAQNDLAVRRAALAQLIARPVGDVNELRPGVTLEGPQPAGESDWVQSARDNNLLVQQQRLAADVAQREIERRRAAYYPSIDLVGNVGHGRNSAFNLIGVRTDSAAIGVQLSVPLYTGGLIQASVREATALLDRSLSDLESSRRLAEQNARQAYLGLNSGLAQVGALEAAERSSRLALDSNVLGYQVGVRINIDVLNAQQQLFATQSQLARARYDALLSGLTLKSTTGILSETDLARINALLVPPRASTGDSGAGTTAQALPPPQGAPGATPPQGAAPGAAPASGAKANPPAPAPNMPRQRGGRVLKR